MNKIIILFGFCMSCLNLSASDLNPKAIFIQENKISIKEAWERVLNNHQGIKAEEFGVQKANKISLASKLSFLPSIDLTGFYIHLAKPLELDLFQNKAALNGATASLPPAFSGIGSIFEGLASPIELSKQDIIIGALNIVYPLYMGGARFYASKIAVLHAKDALEALRLRKLATFEELVKVYYGVVLNQEVLDVLQGIEKGHYTHYQNAIKMQKAGQIARIEVLSAQVAYDRAKTKTAEAANSLEVARLAFDTILSSQTNLFLSSTLTPDTNKTLPNSEYFVKETLSSYPVLRTLENQVLSTQEVKKLQLSKFLPQVGLFGSYLMKGQNSILNRMIPDWYIGIGARLPIITPEGRIQKYQAAKLAVLQVHSLKEQAIKDMKLLSQKVYKEVISAAREYKSLDSSIELAKENLKLQEQAFTQGLATSAQVVDARNTFSSILIEQKTIGYKYIIHLANLMALSGHLDMFYDYQN
ncbi:TolC family protein [Helicobacter sp. 13S00477-4]|uniref:TolC family protein n=1 Tax=Helicobacter sp. 13S00477-4 TaxID=1905759 RepID=UPI000BA6556C|nr:TolC family protein [Helicobacter sp. 13S00477-4]PAF50327.1 lipase [Helicobacter sp. 13S00477-4]